MGMFHPGSLIWSLLAILIVALYVVRYTRRSREVSTMLLWDRALARRRPWRRWQRLVSLAAQVLIFLVILLVLTHPFWPSLFGNGRSLVVIVDNSASMNATDVEVSRLWQARRQAEKLIDDVGLYDQMAILSAGPTVRVLSTLVDDRPILRSALEKLQPTDGDVRIDDAMALARRIIEYEKNGHIVVLSDGCFDSAEELATANDVTLVRSAPPKNQAVAAASNVAVTRAAARPSLVDPSRMEVFFEIVNFGSAIVKCGFDFGSAANSQQLELPPREPVRKFFSLQNAASGLHIARLDVNDHLAADNQVAFFLPATQAASVVLTAPPATQNETAFSSMRTALDLAAPGRVRLASGDQSILDSNNDAILHVYVDQTPEILPEGPILAFAPEGENEFFRGEAIEEGPRVIAMPLDAMLLKSVFEGVDLSNIVIDAVRSFEVNQPTDAVITAESGEPIISAWDRPGGRVLLVHFPLAKSDFALKPSFPVFVANALDWLQNRASLRNVEFNTTSDVITLNSAVFGSDRSLQCTSPTGESRTVPVGQALVGPLAEVGIWMVAGEIDSAGESTDPLIFPVNLLDSRESDLTPSAAAAFKDLPLRGALDSEPLWAAVLFVALLFVIVEFFLFHRGFLV